MAEVVTGIVVAEAIKVLFKGVKSYVLERYLDRTGVQNKLAHLNMLVIKINSELEVSMKFNIKSDSSLCRWQEELKKATTEGQGILNIFKDQAGSASSSSSGPANCIKKFIFPDDNINKLDNIIEKLEGISIANFTELLEIECFRLCMTSEETEEEPIFTPLHRAPSVLHKTPPVKIGEPTAIPLPETSSQPESLHWRPESRHWRQRAKCFFSQSSTLLKANKRKRVHQDEISWSSSELNLSNFKLDSTAEAAQVPNDVVIQSIQVPKEAQTKTVTNPMLQLQIQREAARVESLVAQIMVAIDKAKQRRVDGPCLREWLAQLEEVVEEGECVASAVKPLNYNYTVYTEEVLQDILTILTGVRARLEKMNDDVKSFLELVELTNKVVDLAPATGSKALSHLKQVATGKRTSSD